MSQAFLDKLPKQAGLLVFSLVLLTAVGCMGYSQPQSEEYGQPEYEGYTPPQSGVSVGFSYSSGGHYTDSDYLAQYGVWVSIPHFGLCWQPDVVGDWQPFSNGHWAWTSNGWAWVSYEPFGDLVYHYGYWDYQEPYGWFWIPGNTWSPARVQWYTFGDYTAWAPLPPPGVVWPYPWVRSRTNVWLVVGFNDFLRDDIGHHRFRGQIGRPVYGGRETYQRRAPDMRFIQQRTGRSIQPIRIAREPMNIQREVTPARRGFDRGSPFQRMVLPQHERDRVNQYQPQVERDVLRPRKEGGQEQRQMRPGEQRQPEQRQVQPPPEKRAEEPKQPVRQQRGNRDRRGRR